MKNSTAAHEIDIVYLWVDGNDPIWQAKRHAIIGNVQENTAINCKGRFANNDELKYSLRSVQKYAPWVRKIFIVTDSQTPHWLNTSNPKVQIVDHKEIMPPMRLPSINSSQIEHSLYKIPGLSEHFLYANDDMFINKPIFPHTFFAADGLPIIRLYRKPFKRLRWYWKYTIRKKPLLRYSCTVVNASKLVKKKFGIYYGGMPHHNIDAYLKSGCKRVVEEIFKEEFDAVLTHRHRTYDDIQRIIYLYVALTEKRGHLRYVTRKKSFLLRPHKVNDYAKLERYNPTLFCLNDSEHVKDSDRERLKAWLLTRFPEKSAFEK